MALDSSRVLINYEPWKLQHDFPILRVSASQSPLAQTVFSQVIAFSPFYHNPSLSLLPKPPAAMDVIKLLEIQKGEGVFV